jgi:jacalin-like lectin domain-containing protein/delta endotoxin-like protein
MRIRNLWRITSNSSDKVVVWIFNSEDTHYIAEISGQKFWLEKNETRETEIGPDKVQIGFRKGTSALSGWVAKPTAVETNRDVALTSKNKISFPKNSMFDPVEKVKDIQFITEAQSNNIARQVVMWGIGKIPGAGAIISNVVGVLWKEIKPNVESLIEQSERRMQSWVRSQIAQLKRENLDKLSMGLLANLNEYRKAKDQKRRYDAMGRCISNFNEAMPYFMTAPYTVGTIGLGTEIATIHIALLRERVLFADEIGISEANRQDDIDTLAEKIDAYKKFVLETAIDEEIKWRMDEDTIDSTSEIGFLNYKGYYLRDTIARQTFFYSDQVRGYSRNTSDSYVNRDYYLRQAKSSYENSLTTNVADVARLLTLMKITPDTLQPVSLDRLSWVGPCTGLIYKNGNEHGATADKKMNTHGDIAEIIVRAHNEVDYIKVIYKDGKSSAIGNEKGSTQYSVKLKTGVFITKVETWWDWELVGIKFHLSDGTSSAKFGDKTGMGRHHQIAAMDNHILSGIQTEGGTEAKVGNAMSLGFRLRPDFYDLGQIPAKPNIAQEEVEVPL